MLDFMKTFVKFVLINMFASTLVTPTTANAESGFLDAAKSGSRVAASLDFSIVVLPRLQVRVRVPQAESLVDSQARDPQAAFAQVLVEANSGSVSFHSTVVGPKGATTIGTTMAADRKLVRADSRRIESLRNIQAGQGRSGGVTYTVTQL
jgi:hypothetical protein